MEKQINGKKGAVEIFVTAFLALLLIFAGSTLLQPPEKISGEAYRAAFAALDRYHVTHPADFPRFLAVVDYSKPSYVKRMTLIDLRSGDRSFFRVAHGKKSGMLYPAAFSNIPQSNMSSLGLFRVLEPYYGDHGKAMRLEGLDRTVNDSAFVRDIVLHSADYVSPAYILLNFLTLNGPMIGRSNGCFVVSPSRIDGVVSKLAEGALIYAWADTSAIRANR
jgi:hypothetical protein